MKNIISTILIIVFCVSTTFGQSENYRMVRFDFGFSYIAPSSDRFVSGFGFSPELKFQVTDKHTIGVKTEIFVMVGDNSYILQGSHLSSKAELKTGTILSFAVLNEFFF